MKNNPDYFIAIVYVAAILLRYLKARRLLDFPNIKNKRFLTDQVLEIEKMSMWVTIIFMIKYSGVTVYSSATCILTVISGMLFLRSNKEASPLEFLSSISCMALIGLTHIAWYSNKDTADYLHITTSFPELEQVGTRFYFAKKQHIVILQPRECETQI